MRSRILRWIAIGLTTAIAVATVAFLRDMRRAQDRISGQSTVIPSPMGDIEYTDRGAGPPVLVIHGSGGGHDQGELIAETVLDDRFRRIIPSRFGYLRSTFHDGATFDDQAHAYAHLLDRLGIPQVAVVALSHGGPSALLFAARYPERVSSLTLLSAGVASAATDAQASANDKGNVLTAVFRHDVLYWGIVKTFRRRFLRLLGADDAVISRLTEEQRQLANRMIDYMHPASWRSAGVAFDNAAAMPNERIAAITAPTLIVHATDDSLQLFHNAEFAASRIRGATLRRYDRGGHLLVIVEREAIAPLVQEHILAHGASIGASHARERIAVAPGARRVAPHGGIGLGGGRGRLVVGDHAVPPLPRRAIEREPVHAGPRVRRPTVRRDGHAEQVAPGRMPREDPQAGPRAVPPFAGVDHVRGAVVVDEPPGGE